MNPLAHALTAKEFEESHVLRDLCLPSSSCQLITKDKTWYYKLTTNNIFTIKKSDLPANIDFDLKISKKPEVFYGEIIRIMHLKYNKPVEEFDKSFGFDVETLPDSNYLLKCIYMLENDNIFVNNLPKINTNTNTLQKALDREIEKKILQFAVEGLTIQHVPTFDFSALKDEVERALNVYMAYKICKIDKSRLLKHSERIVRQAAVDPVIRSIANNYQIQDVFGDNKTISAEMKENLEKIKDKQAAMIIDTVTFPPR